MVRQQLRICKLVSAEVRLRAFTYLLPENLG
jgi:hypothetical protein